MPIDWGSGSTAAPSGGIDWGGAVGNVVSGGAKAVSRLGSALDYQRSAVAKKAGLGSTPDQQFTNMRKKLGVEKDYQDPSCSELSRSRIGCIMRSKACSTRRLARFPIR
jgi:hypothetical protein